MDSGDGVAVSVGAGVCECEALPAGGGGRVSVEGGELARSGDRIVRCAHEVSLRGRGIEAVVAVEHTQGNRAVLKWLLYDGHGNLVRTMAPDYTLSDWQFRGVWGEVQGSLQLGRGYCANLGHPEDETGLVYMRARYYEPATGRFISEDPAQDGVNWYLYCDGNPVINKDFLGTFLLPDQAEAVAEGLGLEARAAAALRAFSNWYADKLARAVSSKTVTIIVQFVEDSAIEVGMGAGSFTLWRSQALLIVQLASGGRNLRTFIHELAEALIVARGRGGIVSEAEEYLLKVFQQFLQGS